MDENLKFFKVIPSVVKADAENEITIKSVDGIIKLYDDVTYNVKFIPQDFSDVPIDKDLSLLGYNLERKTYQVKPVNGELKIKYYFADEQEWKIHISVEDYEKYQNPLYKNYVPYWNSLIALAKNGVTLSVYSLYEDLYSKKVMRGDLHIHSCESDGMNSPEMVAACYRKDGRDFLAITDHHIYHASKDAEKKLAFVENFKMLRGEEVHNKYAGLFHMVNIGSNYSVNDIYLNNKEKVEREVKELEKEVEVPENLDKHEYLNRVWLYREIKKSGGYAIYPHPYWYIGFYHTSTKMSRAIIKNGLCDAFEVLGGCGAKNIDLQVALYNDLRAEGCDIPIVGSTDSHSVLNGEEHLRYSTIVFAENDDIIGAIADKYSVAVEDFKGVPPKAYGRLRLVMYTKFLMENYFPIHDELCNVSGTMMCDYVHGNEDLKEDIIRAEERLSKYCKEFFGR